MSDDGSQRGHGRAVPPTSFAEFRHLVAHDVIAPLTAVHRLVEILERRWDAIPDDTRRIYLATARDEMLRTIDLVQHMTDTGSAGRSEA